MTIGTAAWLQYSNPVGSNRDIARMLPTRLDRGSGSSGPGTMSKNAKKRQLVQDVWKMRNMMAKKNKVPRRSPPSKKSNKSIEREQKFLEKVKTAATIVIDLDYDEKMTETEQKSLSQQIMYCYGANKRAKKPFNIFLSKLGGKTQENLNNICGFPDNWLACEVDREQKGYENIFDKNKLIYLSADSPNVLEEIEDDKVYILGGIVDRNRHKNVTYQKAMRQNIHTARFPLRKFCSINSGSHILTVNHCYDILLSRYNSDDWISTFRNGIPSRKDLQIKPEFAEKDTRADSEITPAKKMRKSSKPRKKTKREATLAPLLKSTKLAVLVGGSGGIGFGFASNLLDSNCGGGPYTLLLVGRNGEKLDEAKIKLLDLYPNVGSSRIHVFKCDCARKVECYMLRDHIRATFGKKRGTVQLLINCAGMFMWDKDVPKGNDPCMYLNDANVNTKKYVLEVLIPLMLPENYAPLGEQKEAGVLNVRNAPQIVLVGSHAGSPTFKEEIEQKEGKGATDRETGYIYAMAALRSWALRMQVTMGKKGIYLTLLEPGLVDTEQARRSFGHLDMDWNSTLKPAVYAKRELSSVFAVHQ